KTNHGKPTVENSLAEKIDSPCAARIVACRCCSCSCISCSPAANGLPTGPGLGVQVHTVHILMIIAQVNCEKIEHVTGACNRRCENRGAAARHLSPMSIPLFGAEIQRRVVALAVEAGVEKKKPVVSRVGNCSRVGSQSHIRLPTAGHLGPTAPMTRCKGVRVNVLIEPRHEQIQSGALTTRRCGEGGARCAASGNFMPAIEGGSQVHEISRCARVGDALEYMLILRALHKDVNAVRGRHDCWRLISR